MVAPKTALQAAGEREEGESLERTRRKARQEESRKSGTFSSGSQSMKVDASKLASPSSTSHQVVNAELFSWQMSSITEPRLLEMSPVHV